MNPPSKVEKPTLVGVRSKARKRDEREKLDPVGFRDQIINGLEQVSQGNKSQNSTSTQQRPRSPQNSDITNAVEKIALDEPVAVNGKDAGSQDTNDGETGSSPDNEVRGGDQDDSSSDSGGTPTHTRKHGTGSPVPPQLVIPATPLDVEGISKYLDHLGSKLDYRRYGDVLFDIIIAGGILAPGGEIKTDTSDPSKKVRTDVCLFLYHTDSGDANDLLIAKSFASIIIRIVRRYKYLEKTLDEELKRIILFLRGFTNSERIKLAKLTAVLINAGQCPATVLGSALQDTLVKDGLALDFFFNVLETWVQERQDPASVWNSLRKANLDSKIPEFFPSNKRNSEHIYATFRQSPHLKFLVDYQKAQENNAVKKELASQVETLVTDGASVKEIIATVKDAVNKHSLPEHEVVVLLWNTLMKCVEWNKKEELVTEQAMKHLRTYSSLLANFTNTAKAELSLIITVQEYCYENMNFMKSFQKIIILFYKTDILSEDSIIKWYKESHSPKGKSVFLEQSKKFVEWLQTAESEDEDEEDE